jgi:phosphohistidine swiveling domain-containing protein
LRLVDGVIAESGSDLDSGRLSQVNRRLVWITDAPDVMRTLESGLSVTVDGEQGLVYEGII